MTREEVRQQLAKNPLVWERNIEGNLAAEVCALDREVRITFLLLEGDVYIKAHRDGAHRAGEFLGVEGSEEELKCIAEAHRLDLVCRMLGIKN